MGNPFIVDVEDEAPNNADFGKTSHDFDQYDSLEDFLDEYPFNFEAFKETPLYQNNEEEIKDTFPDAFDE